MFAVSVRGQIRVGNPAKCTCSSWTSRIGSIAYTTSTRISERCGMCSGLAGLWRMHQAYLFSACTRVTSGSSAFLLFVLSSFFFAQLTDVCLMVFAMFCLVPSKTLKDFHGYAPRQGGRLPRVDRFACNDDRGVRHDCSVGNSSDRCIQRTMHIGQFGEGDNARVGDDFNKIAPFSKEDTANELQTTP